MKIKASEIYNRFSKSGILSKFEGDDQTITGFQAVEFCKSGDLVFIDREEFIDYAVKGQATCIVTSPQVFTEFIKHEKVKSKSYSPTVLISSNVSLAQALLRAEYCDRNFEDNGWPNIHSSAVIHKSVTIHQGCRIAPNVIIEKGVTIGKGSVILSGSVIEHDVTIGEDCVIHPNVSILYGTKIGDRVTVKSGAVIGSEGFGYAKDDKNRYHRIPQLGIVIIEDDVSVGGNCVIDRATYVATKICAGTKIDNLCHIAHNVEVGENSIILAGTVIAGSTKIGARVVFSGQTGVLNHLKISDDVVLLHRAGVVDDIDKAGVYAGLPTRPLDEHMKIVACESKLNDMRKKLNSLEHIVKKDNSSDGSR